MMKVLFICTHNRCRSIMAEALGRHYGKGLMEVASAGSAPEGQIHPLAIHFLEKHCITTAGLKSQSWDAYRDFNPDVVITLCDNASKEPCPLWLGDSERIHWGLQDPSRASGREEDVEEAFNRAIGFLRYLIKEMVYWLELELPREHVIAKMKRLECTHGGF